MDKGLGPLCLRIVLGLLFIIPGIQKLTGMLSGGHPIVGMLWDVTALAWLLLLSEIIFGAAVLVGWQLKYTVWPLVIIMVGAIFIGVIPNMGGSWTNLLFHVLAIVALKSLYLSGPGSYAVE